MQQHSADAASQGGLYLLADVSFAPVAGNLKRWPQTLNGPEGWAKFKSETLNPKARGEQSLFRARWETLPDGFHVLVAKNIDDLGRFANEIYAALAFAISFIFVLAVVASVSVTRRYGGQDQNP